MKIAQIIAQEILDSRGNPTVETQLTLENGVLVRSAVPSGASTGSHEALELRDNDPERYHGKGVLKAVTNVNQIIAPQIVGLEADHQAEIDQIMIELDGTPTKSKLGANAILSVSMAVVKAAAVALSLPFYAYIARLFGRSNDNYLMPIPMMNVLNGGKHAAGSTDMQEFMIMPIGAASIQEAVRYGAEVFQTLGQILQQKNLSVMVGDEGGYAPKLPSNEAPLELIIQAIEQAGYRPGQDISIALDPAASEFYQNNQYQLSIEQQTLTSQELISRYRAWTQKYPIISIEDGLAEDDWSGFSQLTADLGQQIQIVGDDLFVTDVERLQKGIETKAANSILIKLNQIGTVSETINAVNLARQAKMTAIISHRSGETEDSFIADFVVGAGTGQIKIGSLCRSERIAKYNQLMRIERVLKDRAQIAKFPFPKFS